MRWGWAEVGTREQRGPDEAAGECCCRAEEAPAAHPPPLTDVEKAAVRHIASGLTAIARAQVPARAAAAAHSLSDDWTTYFDRFGYERTRYLGRISARYFRLRGGDVDRTYP